MKPSFLISTQSLCARHVIILWAAVVVLAPLGGCRPADLESARDFVVAPVQSDLPITKVVLYQNGVGYFERRGKIKGNRIRLRIRPDQVKDLLKSLTVVDFRGGRATTVSLPAERKAVQRLSRLPQQVQNSGGLLTIAQAFRGATAVIKTAKGKWTGRLVGVENMGTGEKPEWRLSLLRKHGVISAYAVKEIVAMKVLDKGLTLGLSKSLDVALNKGKWKPVTLTIRLTGSGPHDLVVSYVVPMPTWKPAYRLVMGEDGKGVLLQSWCVVDNLSGESWKKVNLSLTAGTPLAFKYDLYSPRHVRRPDLTAYGQQKAEAPPPPTDATAREEAEKKVKAKERARRPRRRYRRYHRKGRRKSRRTGGSAGLRSLYSGAPSSAPARDAYKPKKKVTLSHLSKSYRTLVSGTSVGSLFRYDIEEPVTVPDRSSALVSIINKKVSGNDVLYFLVGSRRPNPYRAVKFKNTTGYVLERGPVAIYRQGAFVGEAVGGRVEKNAVTFVPYAVEGRTIVHLSSHTADEGVKLVKIVNGYITVSTKNVTHFKYKVLNRTGEPLTLYVTRRRRSGWKVIQPQNVIMEKKTYYAPIPLKARGTTKFTVKEATPVKRRYTIFSSRARKAIELFLSGSEVSSALKKQLKGVLSLWEKIADLQTRMSTLAKSMSMLRKRTKEIRSNLKVLGKKSNQDLRRKLLRNLTRVEDELNELNGKWVKLNMERGRLKQRLQVKLRMVSFKRD
jgi:hypothetical protein